MSLKNEKDLSDFGRKLLLLMDKKKCESPKELATALYEKKLVTVKSHSSDIYKARINAIGSIEKKIRAHIRAKDARCLQGEYVHAYCQFFCCSADFLFGYTEIESSNIDIRQICEKTGLSERAVKNLVEPTEYNVNACRGAWSAILESQLYTKVPEEWLMASNQAILVAQNEAQRKAAEWEMDKVSGKDKLALQEDVEGYIQESQSASAAMAGLLFNISRNVAGFIEHHINGRVSVVKEKYDAAFMDEARNRHKSL